MTDLLKARLAEITAGDNPTEVSGTSVDVPFNPTSLRVQISNKTAGGQQAGAQARQRPGTGEMQVSFDLIFDVADLEDGDVLEHTKMVERFVRPQGTQPGKEAPPRVLFQWGSFLVQGTMDSANIDLDLFDASGIPLRAKVAVTIKGQDPRWVYQSPPAHTPNNTGSGSGSGAGGQPNGLNGVPAGLPGTQGNSSLLDKVVQAMPGESLPQLAARFGMAPSAWRALADGSSNPFSLSLGQEVGLPAGLSRGTANGLQSQGQDPGRSVSSLPLVSAPAVSEAAAPVALRAQGVDALRQGQAMAVRGGLGASIEQTKGEQHQSKARQSLQAFGVQPAPTSDAQGRPWGAGVPLRPRVGSGQAPAQVDAQRMALRHPVASANTALQASAASANVGARRGQATSTVRKASTGRSSAGGRGCGCSGRKRSGP